MAQCQLCWCRVGGFGLDCSKKSPTVGPTERFTDPYCKPEYLIAQSQLRGPLGFGRIQFLDGIVVVLELHIPPKKIPPGNEHISPLNGSWDDDLPLVGHGLDPRRFE